MFQGTGFVYRFTCRIAIISAVTLAFVQCSLQAQTFAPPINISGENSNAVAPRIALDSNGNVNVVWLDDSGGTPAVFFSRSSDSGQTFSTPLNISNHQGSPAESERVAVDAAGNIYVVWSEDSSGAHTIFFSRSIDNGVTFSVPQKVSQNSTASDPAVAIDSAGGINLLWIDRSQGQRTVFFSRSSDQGTVFSTPVVLSNAEAGSGAPQLITDPSGNRYVVWTQDGTGKTESVFFSRYENAAANLLSSGPAKITGKPSFDAVPMPSDAAPPMLTPARTSDVSPRSSSMNSRPVLEESGSPINSARVAVPVPANVFPMSRRTVRAIATPGFPASAQTSAALSGSCSISREHSQMVGPNGKTCNSVTATSQRSALLSTYPADAVQYFDCVHYSCFPDIGQGVNKALSDVGEGGTVMISLGAIRGTVATTIIVGRNQSLICDPATVLQPANTSVNMIAVGDGATIRGCSINATNQSTYAGAVFSFTGNYRDDSHTSLSDIMINAAGNVLCDGILMSASNVDTQSIAFVSLTNIHIYGCNNGLHLLSDGGFVNGNLFQDVHVSWAVHAFNFQNTSTAAGATISGNECLNCSSQRGPLSVDSVHIAGIASGENVQNTFAPFTAWDYGTPIWLDSSADFNVFMGRWDGTVRDSTALNTYITGGQAAFTQPGAYISENATDSFIATTDSATQQKAMHLRNAGGNLYVGVDNNTGSGFGDPYGSVWYSPNNNSYFVSPVSTFTGTVHQALTVSDAGPACTKGENCLLAPAGASPHPCHL